MILYKEDKHIRLACPACHGIRLQSLGIKIPARTSQLCIGAKCLDCKATVTLQIVLGAKRITITGGENG